MAPYLVLKNRSLFRIPWESVNQESFLVCVEVVNDFGFKSGDDDSRWY